jgi:2-C-methyl-D-erythritol 4-phosphate cytidylyltransferase
MAGVRTEKKGKNVAVILAGGQGVRLDYELPKQFVKVAGKPIIAHTIEVFERHPLINEIYIVVFGNYYWKMEEIVKQNAYKKVRKILNGGKTRQESSMIGIFACDDNVEKILLHDAVRPFISEDIISEVLSMLDKYPAVDVGIPVSDTIIKVLGDRIIADIPERKYLWRGQTPQGFRLPVIKKAHLLAEKEDVKGATDDCSLVLRYNLGDIYVVDGSEHNIKVTYPLDISIADKIFQIRNEKIYEINTSDLKKSLKNKVIVVFGGASGIGLEICKLGKELGAYTHSFSRRTDVDVRKLEDVKTALEKVYRERGKIDAIVNAASILKMAFIETADESDIIEQINTNLIGNVNIAKAGIPYLKVTCGSFTFFASSSYTRGREGYLPYSASKAGLVNFGQGLADEVSHYGIKVLVINPERTDTPLRRKAFGVEDKSLLLSAKFVALVTLKAVTTDLSGVIIGVSKQDEINYFKKS